MAQAEVIREYLVGLGFKTDERSLKKFTDGIDGAAKGVLKLVAAIEGAALAVGAGVAAFGSNLEQLYRVSQRTAATTGEIKALDLAAQSLGANAGDSTASLEGLAKFVRETPGGGAQSLLRAWGIDATVLDGQLVNVGDAYVQLAKKFQGMSFAEAQLYGKQLGINDNTLMAMRKPDFEANYRRELSRTGGLQESARLATQMMVELRDIMLQIYVLGARVVKEVFASFGVEFKDFGTWLRDNGDLIVSTLSMLIEKLLILAKMVFPALKWLWDKLVELDTATDGWSTKLIAMLAVLNSLGALSLISGIAGLTGAFTSLGGAITAAAVAAGAIVLPLATVAAMVGHDDLNAGEAEWLAQRDEAQKNGKPMPPLPGVSKKLMDFFTGYGWTKEQAAGIVGNLAQESSLNPGAENATGHYGLAQWDKTRQESFKKWRGKDIRDYTDPNEQLLDQARFIQWELTKGDDQGARKAGEMIKGSKETKESTLYMEKYYERSGGADLDKRANYAAQAAAKSGVDPEKSANYSAKAAATDGAAKAANEPTVYMNNHYDRSSVGAVDRRSDNSAQVSQTTTINVTGVSDPVAAGQAVVNAQGRVNADLTRNLQTSVR